MRSLSGRGRSFFLQLLHTGLRGIEFGGGSDHQLPRVGIKGIAARDQSLSIREYGYGFSAARSVQVASARPCLGRGVPKLGRIDGFGFVVGARSHRNEASRDQNLSRLEQRPIEGSATARRVFLGELAARGII